jgi:hypothetical protein
MVTKLAGLAVSFAALAAGCDGKAVRRDAASAGASSGSSGDSQQSTGGRGAGANGVGASGGAHAGESGSAGAGAAGAQAGVGGAQAGGSGAGGTTSAAAGEAGEESFGTAGDGGAAGDGGTLGGSAGDGAAGDVGAGGADAPGEFPPRPLCGPEALPDNHERFCGPLAGVRLEVGPVFDAGDDGTLLPGDEAYVVVTMQNPTAELVQAPCIGLLSDDPRVTILGGKYDRNPEWIYFGIGAEQSLDQTMRFRLEPSLPPGERVRFVTWIDVDRSGCTNGAAVEFELVVGG